GLPRHPARLPRRPCEPPLQRPADARGPAGGRPLGATGGFSLDSHGPDRMNAGTPDHSPSPDDAAVPDAGWLVRNGPYLVLFAALVAFLRYRGWDLLDFWNLLKVVIGLGTVIFIHELGHFLVAKWCDVHVETFSIGFGPPLPGCSFRYGETRYMVALFPPGGYAKVVGEAAEDDVADTDTRSVK